MTNLPRLSPAEQAILAMLVEHGDLFGLQLVERSGGRLKRGTVYVTLGRMQEKGYLESRQEALPPGAIGLPRRLYHPTGHGCGSTGVASRRADVSQPRRGGGVMPGNAGCGSRGVFDGRTADIFEPLVADWQHEWQRARGSSWQPASAARAPLAYRAGDPWPVPCSPLPKGGVGADSMVRPDLAVGNAALERHLRRLRGDRQSTGDGPGPSSHARVCRVAAHVHAADRDDARHHDGGPRGDLQRDA